MSIKLKKLLDAVIVTGAGRIRALRSPKASFQAIGVTSAGAGAATIVIEASNDQTNWITIGTITLVLSATAANDGFVADAAWAFARANVTAISGTNASVTVWVGD